MNLSATIAKMRAAGMTSEAIVLALECLVIESEKPAASLEEIRAERKREADRVRMADRRATVALQSRDTGEKKVPDKEIPHTPLEINLQEKTPSTRDVGVSSEELAFEAWNALAAALGLPRAQFLTPERRRKIRTRLAECGGLDGWRDALAKIRGSPWCQGENDRGWRADLDFLLQRKSFTKLMEGSYDGRSGRAQTAKRNSIHDTLDAIDAVTDEAIRRANGYGAEGGEEDFDQLPGLRKSAV